jgi:glutamyl-tRNA synthetase
MIVGRLAPSPTGAQHLGNARTYLIAWLAARAVAGRVILRVEDIDTPRVKPWATKQAMDDLRWLGLDWDEGPDIGGPAAPYLQTERTLFYQQALERLIAAGQAYPCVCTRSDIEQAASAPHVGQEGPRYPGTCSHWQLGDPLPQAKTYCWRLRSQDQKLQIDDIVVGRVELNPANDLGDFPLTRKDSQAAYQLAVVVDDAAMGVNQVVRGDDLLPSAFRQLQICRALDLPIPQYAHLPLVVGHDGKRLAKRHGDTRLSWYREKGIRAQQIIGWAAYSIGLTDAYCECCPADLLDTFAWEKLSARPHAMEIFDRHVVPSRSE